MKYWTTKEGEEILLNKLEDSHLLNIEALIKRKANEGMTLVTGGGNGWDGDDVWFDEEEIKGKGVLDYFGYKSIAKEIKRRKLKIIK